MEGSPARYDEQAQEKLTNGQNKIKRIRTGEGSQEIGPYRRAKRFKEIPESQEKCSMSDDWDYECMTCSHRIRVPFDKFYSPDVCEECGDALSYLSKKIIEENERINAEES